MLAVCYGLKCRSEIKELGVAVDRLGQSEPAAGGVNGRGIADLGLDLHNVGQGGLLAARDDGDAAATGRQPVSKLTPRT